jgi:hypothetical protein
MLFSSMLFRPAVLRLNSRQSATTEYNIGILSPK